MTITRTPDFAEPVPKRRLPIQIANEARMLDATIELLRDHPVDEITSRMIAQTSGTATNYISRYFGGRDGLFLAVASQLSLRISGLVRSEESVIEIDRPGNYVTRIMTIPEVAMWFKVYRYLSGRELPGLRSKEKPALVASVEEAITLIFGLEGEYVPICANVFLTYIMGYAAFGPFLGATDEEAEQALATMATAVTLLVEHNAARANA
jgi:AcrR family transcriptional regulator